MIPPKRFQLALLLLVLPCCVNYALSIRRENLPFQGRKAPQVLAGVFLVAYREHPMRDISLAFSARTLSAFQGGIPSCSVRSPSGMGDSSKDISSRGAETSRSFAEPVPGVASQESHPNPSVERANAIVHKAIVAHGGETKILSVRNATYEYQVESLGDAPSKPITIKTFFKDDSFFRSEAYGDNLGAITILNGDKGWLKVGDTTLSLARSEVDPLKTSMITQLRPELLLLVFPKRRYSGRIDENDLSLDQVEISGFIGVEYVRGRLSFDAATSRLYKYEYEIERESAKGKGIVKGEERYLRYGDNDGLKFPEEILSKQVKKTSRLKVLKADFNSPLSEDLFQDPNPPASTPK